MTAGTGGPHATWSSPLAAALQRFLEGKRAAGYRYRAEAEGLGALDRFLRETLSPTDPVITNDIVRAFGAGFARLPDRQLPDDAGQRLLTDTNRATRRPTLTQPSGQPTHVEFHNRQSKSRGGPPRGWTSPRNGTRALDRPSRTDAGVGSGLTAG